MERLHWNRLHEPGTDMPLPGLFLEKEQTIRLIATDMDGTLLDDPQVVPQDFMDWVAQHPELCIVIASGRQYYNMRKLFGKMENNLVFIAENGGIVFEHGKVVYVDEMRKEDVMDCLCRLGNQEEQAVILCGAKSAYMQHHSQETERNAKNYYENLTFVDDLTSCVRQDQIVKIAVFYEAHNAEENYAHLSGWNQRLQASLSGESWIDLANVTANKGNALEMLQDNYQISREESMAFGDYLNDIGLLQRCEMSFAMENAHPDLKKIAKYIAPSNREGGVQKVLRAVLP